MAQTIKLKRSATQNAVPSTSALELGEIAINTYDGKLFIKKNISGTESIVTIGELSDNSVSSAKIAANAVGASEIAANAITSSEIAANAVDSSELVSTGVTSGSYGSSSAIPVVTVGADGRVTSLSTASISGLSANSVTATEIAKNAVGSSEIAANSVGIDEINVSDGTNGQALITDGNGNLSFGTVASDSASSAVALTTDTATSTGSASFTLSISPTSENNIIAFADGVFQNQDSYSISGNTLTFDTAPDSGTKMVFYSVGAVYSGQNVTVDNFSGDNTTVAFTLSDDPQDENNTQVYIDGVYQQKTEYSVSGTTLTFSSAPPTGTNNIEVIIFSAATIQTIANNAAVSTSIASNAVLSRHIAANAITASEIASGTVIAADIADNTITAVKLASDSVTGVKIADNAIGASHIAKNAVDSSEIVSGSIDTTHLGDSQVTNVKLANSSVTINSNSLSLGGTLTLDTDDISEGSTNLYYTNARADARIAAATTDDLSEGSTNLYYTTARWDTKMAAADTDDLSEGASNLYYTDARVDSHLSGGSGITYSSGAISIAGNAITSTMIAANAVGSSEIAASGVTAGSYGSATAIPTLTIDADGRVTSASTASISSSLTIAADSGSNDTVTIGTDTLTFAGTTNEIETTVSDNQIQIGLPDDVVITGNLTVNGTTVTNSATNTTIEDLLIELGTGTTGTPANDAGIVIERGDSDNAFIGFDESADKFTLGTGSFTGASTGNLTITTGTLVANIEGNVTGDLTGTASAIADNAVTAAKIAANSVGIDELNVSDGTSGQFLSTNGSGTLSFASATSTIAGATDTSITSPSGGQLLIYDGTNSWDNISLSGDATVAANGTVTISANAISSAEISANSIGIDELNVSDGTNGQALVTNGSGTLSFADVSSTLADATDSNISSPSSGQILVYDGADSFDNVSISGDGTLSNTGALTIASNAVESSMIAGNAVGASQIAANSVGVSELNVSDGTNGQFLQTNGSGTLSFATVNPEGSVVYNYTDTGDGTTVTFDTGVNPQNENNTWVFVGGVYQPKSSYSYSSTSITFSEAPPNGEDIEIITGKVAGFDSADTVLGIYSATTTATATYDTGLSAANENNTFVFLDGVYQPKSTYSFSGTTITFDANTPADMALEVMATKTLSASAVTTGTIAANAVTTAKIASNNVTTASIASNAITSALIAKNAITASEIATNAVTGTELDSGALAGKNMTGNIAFDTNTLYVDSTNSRVGIKTTSPSNTLDVVGGFNLSGNIFVDTNVLATDVANNRVGIGTTSPTRKLSISGTGSEYINIVGGTSSGVGLLLGDSDAEIRGALIYDNATDALSFRTGGNTERMRINSSGNLEFNAFTTHSSLGNVSISIPDRAATLYNVGDRGNITIQASSATSGAQAMSGGRVLINAGNSNNGQSGDIILSSGVNVLNSNDKGKIRFNVGGRTTNEEVMRIDSSGNVGIGTASPTNLLDVENSSGNAAIDVTSGTANLARLNLGDTGGSTRGGLKYDNSNDSMAFRANGSDQMTLSNVGLGIGNTPTDNFKLYVDSTSTGKGLYINAQDGGYTAIGFSGDGTATKASLTTHNGLIYIGSENSGGTGSNGELRIEPATGESMRITSGGVVLVGTTSALQAGNKLTVSGSATGAGDAVVDIRNTTTNDNPGTMSLSKTCTTTGSANKYIHFFSNNFAVGHGAIAANGVGSMAFASASDERLKENIEPITGSLDKILALNPVSFDWKVNGEHTEAGFVAQEVEKVLPEYVATDDDEMKTKNLTGGMTGGYIAVLTKAIQELKTELDAAKARLDEAGL